jgi:hypothetical protein
MTIIILGRIFYFTYYYCVMGIQVLQILFDYFVLFLYDTLPFNWNSGILEVLGVLCDLISML